MKKLLFLLAIPAVLVSCQNDDDGISAEDPLAFMAVGNYWKLAFNSFGGSDTLTLTITEENDNVFTVTITTSNSSNTENWFVNDGYLKTYPAGGSMEDAKSLFKSGGNVGDTWVNPRTTTPGATTTYEIVEIDASETTPSGTYNNLQKQTLTFSDAINTQTNYWSPSVGQVKQTGAVTLTLVETNVQ